MPRIDPEKVKLLHGPYEAPPLRKGDRVTGICLGSCEALTSRSPGS